MASSKCMTGGRPAIVVGIRDFSNWGILRGKNTITIHSGDELFSEAGLVSDDFYARIREILDNARQQAYVAVNASMVHAYWNVGKSIVEQQGGKDRAEYGASLIKGLSERLTEDYGKGFTPTNLRYMRQFFVLSPNHHALRDELSWIHYRMLLKVENDDARAFYLNECAEARWSTRQPERQINSFYYQRLLASRDKNEVRAEIEKLEPKREPRGYIRDPYVLEFLDIEPLPNLYEKDLEEALINQLQSFLLELGRGFSFIARQKHIDLDGEHFYIDLVFYNYILKCFVLVDLKTAKLTHQDVGQMDTYVRVYDDLERRDDDNPTIGIILCAEKSNAIARYSILQDNKQFFASKYQLTLPTTDELEEYIAGERRRLEESSSSAED